MLILTFKRCLREGRILFHSIIFGMGFLFYAETYCMLYFYSESKAVSSCTRVASELKAQTNFSPLAITCEFYQTEMCSQTRF